MDERPREDAALSLVLGTAAAPSPGSGALVAVAAHEGGDRLGVLGTTEDGRFRLAGAVWSSGDTVVTVWLDAQSGLPESAVIDGSLFALRDWSGNRAAVVQLRGSDVLLERDVATDWPAPAALPTRPLSLSEALAGAANAVGMVVCMRSAVVRIEGAQLCGRRGLAAFAAQGPSYETALAASAPGFLAVGARWGCTTYAACGQRLVSDLFGELDRALRTRSALAPGVDFAAVRLRLMGTWKLLDVNGSPWQADGVVDQVLFSYAASAAGDRAQLHSRDVLGCFWKEPVELEHLTPTSLVLREGGVSTTVAHEIRDGRLVTTHPNGSLRRYERVSGVTTLLPLCTSRPTTLSIHSGAAQIGERGRTLPQPLIARVLDRRGAPLAGIPVTFEAGRYYGTDDDGRLSPTDVTDELGYARATWQLSTRGEHNQGIATVATDPTVRAEATACAAFAPAPLQLVLGSIDRRSGVVDVTGVDTRKPHKAPRWDWGDGQTSSGAFPQRHVYANPSVTYRAEVTYEYCDGTRQVEAVTVNSRVENFDAYDGALWRQSQHQLGRGWVRPANVSHTSGRVQLALSAGAYDGSEIRSSEKYQYGSYEARLRTPRAPGSLSAFFLYEANLGLDNDEIDIEIYNDGSGKVDFTTWIGGVQTNTTQVILPFDPGAAFHDYRIEWSPTSVRFVVDGLTRATFTTRVPQRPMHVFSNAWWPTWLSGPTLGTSAALWVDRILY